MSINFYNWNQTDEATRARIMRRSQANIDGVIKIVEPIIEDVKSRGDAALIDYAKKFDGANVTSLKATPEEFEAAEAALDEDLKAAIKHCAANVKKFHAEQMNRVEDPWMCRAVKAHFLPPFTCLPSPQSSQASKTSLSYLHQRPKARQTQQRSTPQNYAALPMSINAEAHKPSPRLHTEPKLSHKSKKS